MLRTYMEEPGGSIATVRKAVSQAMDASIWWKQLQQGVQDEDEDDAGNAPPPVLSAALAD
jgi:hypothetical protein